MMLPKNNRLKKDKDFQKIFKKAGKPQFFGNLSFRATKNFLPVTRFGFVISNKVHKNATRRNSLKRQLRKIARDLISELNPGYDVIVVVQKDFLYPYNQAEIKRQFEEGIKRIGMLE